MTIRTPLHPRQAPGPQAKLCKPRASGSCATAPIGCLVGPICWTARRRYLGPLRKPISRTRILEMPANLRRVIDLLGETRFWHPGMGVEPLQQQLLQCPRTDSEMVAGAFNCHSRMAATLQPC